MTSPLHVILIEDDIGDAVLVERALMDCRQAFNIQHVVCLESALSILPAKKFDVALLDLSLPDSFGLAALEKVQALAPDLPIVVLTGLADDELAMRSLEQGAQDYLVKENASTQLLERALRYAIHRQQIQTENRRLLKEMEIVARHDALTGVLNRHSFEQKLDQEWQRAERYQKPLASVALDIDFFKRINDTYGHAIGDQFLKRVADTVSANKRSIDFVGRLGGEEFCVILPETSEADAYAWAERVRLAIAQLVIPIDDLEVSVTVSLGVADRTERLARPDLLIDHADQAMFIAKRLGRNQTIRFAAINDSANAGQSTLWQGQTVKDFASPLALTLSPHDLIGTAIDRLKSHPSDTIPVLFSDGSLAGILGEDDILTTVFTPKAAEKLVGETMKTQVVTFSSVTPVVEICEFLCRNAVRQIFVVNDKNLPVGIVRRRDLIESLHGDDKPVDKKSGLSTIKAFEGSTSVPRAMTP